MPDGTLPIPRAHGLSGDGACWARALFKLGLLNARALGLVEYVLLEWLTASLKVLRVLVTGEKELGHRLVRLILNMPPVLLVLIAAEANALLLPWVGVKAAVGVPEPIANNAPFVDGSLASLAPRMQRLDKLKSVAARCPLAIHATRSLFGVDAKDTLDGAQHALFGRVVRD